MPNINVKSITVQNFKSFGNVKQTLNVATPGSITTILGEDRDTNIIDEHGVSRNGVGKSQPLSSLVLTTNGYVEMRNIHVGMELVSVDGMRSTVVGVYPQGNLEYYTVTLTNGCTVQASRDHLWKVKIQVTGDCATTQHPSHYQILTTDEIHQLNLITGVFVYIPTLNPITKAVEYHQVTGLVIEGITECQCIKVSHSTSLYITDNNIITHNTTLVCDALEYLIYDHLKGYTNDQLINNNNKKNMLVSGVMEIDGKHVEVTRTRKGKGGTYSNEVKLVIDGNDCTRGTSDQTNETIKKMVNIPHEMFMRIVVFQASHASFLQLSAESASKNSQRSLIEFMFGFELLSHRAGVLNDRMKETKKVFDNLRREYDFVLRERDKLQAILTNSITQSKEWERSLIEERNRLAELKDQLIVMSDEDVAGLKLLQQQFSDLEDRRTSIQHEIKNKIREIKGIDHELKTLAVEINQLQNNNCPYCNQHFSKSAEMVPGKIQLLIELDTAKTQLDDAQKEFERQLVEVDGIINNLTEQLGGIDLDNIIKDSARGAQIDQHIAKLETASNPHELTIQTLHAQMPEIPDSKTLDEMKTTLEHQDLLHRFLSKKDSPVRKSLMETTLPYLNRQIQLYLDQIGMRHEILFDSELQVVINLNDRPFTYNQLSMGQKARVNLALAFAFRDVLQSLHGHINICVLDEILDHSLCDQGVRRALNMVKQYATRSNATVYLVTHKDTVKPLADHHLTIALEDGFSKIE